MEWAKRYLAMSLANRRRYYLQLVRQAAAEEPGQRQLSFAEFERVARSASKIRPGPSGNIQL